jgi:hypothetical protein
MSVKYPIAPEYQKIPKEYYDAIGDLFTRYDVVREEIVIEKNQLRVEKMISYDYESSEIKKKFKALKIKNANNEHDILFLERYPVLAVRHSQGESWGTTSPR